MTVCLCCRSELDGSAEAVIDNLFPESMPLSVYENEGCEQSYVEELMLGTGRRDVFARVGDALAISPAEL